MQNQKQNQKKRIAVVPGDGIGKEVIASALTVMRAAQAPVEFTEFDWSADRYLKDGTTVPPDGFEAVKKPIWPILANSRSLFG